MEEQTASTGIGAKLDKLLEINEKLVEEKKTKVFKLPWGKKVSKSQVKKGWCLFIIIRNNGNLDFIKAPTEDGLATIDGIPRIATIDYKLTYKGMPVCILPEWSLKPFSPVENYADTEQDKMNIAGRRMILAAMESDKIKPKGGAGFGLIGWIVLFAIIGGAIWYLTKGGGAKLF